MPGPTKTLQELMREAARLVAEIHHQGYCEGYEAAREELTKRVTATFRTPVARIITGKKKK